MISMAEIPRRRSGGAGARLALHVLKQHRLAEPDQAAL